jgi:hypothetical protein
MCECSPEGKLRSGEERERGTSSVEVLHYKDRIGFSRPET